MTDVYRRLAPYYFQTAWIVRNQAQAERRFEQVMGIPEWLRFDVTLREGRSYRGCPSHTDRPIPLGFAGDVHFEQDGHRLGGGVSALVDFLRQRETVHTFDHREQFHRVPAFVALQMSD